MKLIFLNLLVLLSINCFGQDNQLNKHNKLGFIEVNTAIPTAILANNNYSLIPQMQKFNINHYPITWFIPRSKSYSRNIESKPCSEKFISSVISNNKAHESFYIKPLHNDYIKLLTHNKSKNHLFNDESSNFLTYKIVKIGDDWITISKKAHIIRPIVNLITDK